VGEKKSEPVKEAVKVEQKTAPLKKSSPPVIVRKVEKKEKVKRAVEVQKTAPTKKAVVKTRASTKSKRKSVAKFSLVKWVQDFIYGKD